MTYEEFLTYVGYGLLTTPTLFVIYFILRKRKDGHKGQGHISD